MSRLNNLPRDLRMGAAALRVNAVLPGLNLALAASSGSLALTAEATHNMLDRVASDSLRVGLILSQRKSRAVPYGLYKVENVVAHQTIMPTPETDAQKGCGIRVAEWLITQHADAAISLEKLDDKGPGYARRTAGVQRIQADTQTLAEVLEQVHASTI